MRRRAARAGADPQTFVLLLRGVNVGKGKRVPMAALRELLADLGFSAIETLLNSGNAVFRGPPSDASAHAAAISAAIFERLVVEALAVVKSAEALDAIVDASPFEVDEPLWPRYLMALASDAEGLSRLSALRPLTTTSERFAIGPAAAYLLCSDGILESKAAVAMLGKAGRGVTSRNWATVLKLRAMASGERVDG